MDSTYHFGVELSNLNVFLIGTAKVLEVSHLSYADAAMSECGLKVVQESRNRGPTKR